MPLQIYFCPAHDEFQITIKFSDDVPITMSCPRIICGGKRDGKKCPYNKCKHIIKPIAGIIVEGGTGGGKDMHLVR